MFCRRFATFIITLVLILSPLVITVNAQEEISSEKKALIKELLEITETKKTYENIIDMVLLQCQNDYPRRITQMLHDAKVPEDKQGEIQKQLLESGLRFSKRFRELYPERLNFQRIMEPIYCSLYNKYFTEDELRDLIIFYKSATGKKSINIMPQLMQESMQKSNESLNPKIIELVNEILQEEKKRLLESKESPRLER